jgi:hypothetical protein
MTAADKRVTRSRSGNNRFVTRRIGKETIIVPVAGRVADLESVYTLNEVGTRVWELLDTPRTPSEIARLVAADYDASEHEVARDVAEFLGVLQESGLIDAGADPVR